MNISSTLSVVLARELAESAVNACDRVRRADEHRLYKIFVFIEAHDLRGASAYIYTYDNAHILPL